ncbi:MAG: YgiT-type zinc finger protein [Deltaproteobacteria bacterium]|nr:MAG: YgiT-type zinc finger protein [Deltaproteobacteria bacterium]
MSSSRPSSRPSRRATCPTCGAKRVAHVTEDVVLRIGARRQVVEAVPHERCEACGEQIFGLEASRRFDRLLGRRRAGRVA